MEPRERNVQKLRVALGKANRFTASRHRAASKLTAARTQRKLLKSA
jgi:hypothetical protein